MSTFRFTVQGIPKGQPRVKACVFGKHARVYTPPIADDWKSAVKQAAHKAGATNAMIMQPVTVNLEVFFPRPKAHYRTGKNAHILRDDAPVAHTSTPDADNVAKAILDALTDACVWRDDSQVYSLSVIKAYGDSPGAQINITANL